MTGARDNDSDELQLIIRTSPVEPVSGYYYVSVEHDERASTVFATISDGVEWTSIIVLPEPEVAAGARRRGPYRLLRLRVSRPFDAPGFLAAACAALAAERCNVLIYSSFSFDYLLVADRDFTTAVDALRRRGFGSDVPRPGVQS